MELFWRIVATRKGNMNWETGWSAPDSGAGPDFELSETEQAGCSTW